MSIDNEAFISLANQIGFMAEQEGTPGGQVYNQDSYAPSYTSYAQSGVVNSNVAPQQQINNEAIANLGQEPAPEAQTGGGPFGTIAGLGGLAAAGYGYKRFRNRGAAAAAEGAADVAKTGRFANTAGRLGQFSTGYRGAREAQAAAQATKVLGKGVAAQNVAASGLPSTLGRLPSAPFRPIGMVNGLPGTVAATADDLAMNVGVRSAGTKAATGTLGRAGALAASTGARTALGAVAAPLTGMEVYGLVNSQDVGGEGSAWDRFLSGASGGAAAGAIGAGTAGAVTTGGIAAAPAALLGGLAGGITGGVASLFGSEDAKELKTRRGKEMNEAFKDYQARTALLDVAEPTKQQALQALRINRKSIEEGGGSTDKKIDLYREAVDEAAAYMEENKGTGAMYRMLQKRDSEAARADQLQQERLMAFQKAKAENDAKWDVWKNVALQGLIPNLTPQRQEQLLYQERMASEARLAEQAAESQPTEWEYQKWLADQAYRERQLAIQEQNAATGASNAGGIDDFLDTNAA